MYPGSPLYTSPFNMVYKIPILDSDHQPSFLQCVRHSIFFFIFGLVLPVLGINFPKLYNIFPHYIHAKLIKLGSDNFSFRLLASGAISKFSQYGFNMEYLTVSPKHVKLPRNN